MRYKIIVLFFLVCSLSTFSQDRSVIDSLKSVLATAKHDTTRIKAFMDLVGVEYDETIWPKYNQEGMDLAAKYLNSPDSNIRISALKGYATGLNNKGYLFTNKGEYDSAFYYYMRAKDLMLKSREKQGAAIVILNLGLILYNKGDYVTALDYYYKAQNIFEEINDKEGLAQIYNNIASVNRYLGNIKKALEFSYRSLDIKKKQNNLFGIANSYNNLGAIYNQIKRSDSAYSYFMKSLAIRTQIKDVRGIANLYNNIGGYYSEKGNYDSATYYLEKTKAMALKLNNQEALAEAYSSFGKLAMKQKEYKKAEDYHTKSFEIASKQHLIKLILSYYRNLYLLKELQNQTNEAFKYFKIYKQMNDSVFNRDNERAVAILQIKNDYEKELYADSLKRAKTELETELAYEKSISKQRLFTYIGASGFGLMLLMALFIFSRYRIKQRNNKILEEKNQIILAQKGKVEQQKEEIQAKNKEIVDSINYAQRIQNALLAGDKLLGSQFKDYFVLFKPKDIVSGDFYWAAPTKEGFLVITGDCTGHGVPGAFMSLLNISKISEIVKEKKIIRPDEILNNLRSEIINVLNPDGSTDESKEGMDCVLISFDKKLSKLEYAAANNSFYVIRNKQLLKLKADHMPVGKSPKDQEPFTYNNFSLEPGDMVYTFTDGYADQFGGKEYFERGGKKFKYRQLEELMIEISHEDLDRQKLILNTRFNEWKGPLEQVDDVLIMGIRIT